MKYLFLLLLTTCSQRDEFFDQACLEEARILSTKANELSTMVFSEQKAKPSLMIDVEFGAYHVERCIKIYAGKK